MSLLFQGVEDNVKTIHLQLYSWTEDNIFFVFSPELDITGYGENQSESINSFQLIVEEFFNHVQENGTLYDELEFLGWTVNKLRKKINQPNIEEMYEENEALREVLSKVNIRKAIYPLSILLP